ncbi:MAG: molybdenum cofactor biosynthesis protein MoaE [Burkholderiaceae bacterium]|nr:molybdenum cofactor biosynthesis protein MoaE [Burkholderiaceae bacterium]
MTARVQTEDFDLTTEVATLRANNPKVGAVAAFVGTVRDLHDGKEVTAMELEHYPGMTQQSLEAIIIEAKQRWNFFDAQVIHRVGPLKPMDQIVLVAVAAMHRREAFAACEFMMDYLKTAAPLWKKEQTSDGARWVDARDSDDTAMARWNENGGKAK